MIWIRYGGIIAGAALILAALLAVVPALVRTRRHANAIVPNALIAKFQKAQGDVGRVQDAIAFAEALVARVQEALARITAVVEVLRSLRAVPRTNRDSY